LAYELNTCKLIIKFSPLEVLIHMNFSSMPEDFY